MTTTMTTTMTTKADDDREPAVIENETKANRARP